MHIRKLNSSSTGLLLPLRGEEERALHGGPQVGGGRRDPRGGAGTVTVRRGAPPEDPVLQGDRGLALAGEGKENRGDVASEAAAKQQQTDSG